MNKQQFIRDLCKTFGTGGLVCSFNDKELGEFHQYLEHKFPFSNTGKVKKGIQHVGRQSVGDCWVLSRTVCIDSNGFLVAENESRYAWQPIGGPVVQLIGKDCGAATINLESDIQQDLESVSSLRDLIKTMRTVFKHNFIPGMHIGFFVPFRTSLQC